MWVARDEKHVGGARILFKRKPHKQMAGYYLAGEENPIAVEYGRSDLLPGDWLPLNYGECVHVKVVRVNEEE